jgi:sugar phosphate permease
VVAGSFLLSGVLVGLGFYGLSVFLDALCSSRGWSRASVSGATTLFFLVSAVTGTLVGRSVDRHGGRGWIAAGACLMAVGLLGIGRVGRPSHLFAAYAVTAAGLGMSSGVPIGAILSRWFVARRARALAVSQSGVSVGGALVVPFASGLIESRGLEHAVLWLAALVVVVTLPVVLFVLRWDPVDHGLEPDGELRHRPENPLLSDAVQHRTWQGREALRTPSFWLLTASFGAVLFAQNGFLMHEVAYLRERVGDLAPWAVSATALGSVAGRLIVGSFADYVSKTRVVQGIFLVQGLALAMLAAFEDPLPVFASALVFGLTIGNVFMMQSLLAAELFGMRSFGRVFGMVQLITSVTGALGPLALGLLFEIGGYVPAIRGLVVVPLAAALLISLLRPPPPDVEAPGEAAGS